MTTEAKSILKWKRALRLAWKIYAGFCTFLITAYLALCLWGIFFPSQFTTDGYNTEASFNFSYKQYMAKEFPRRETYFQGLTSALAMYGRQGSISSADVLKYLGKPDLIEGTEETGALAYIFKYSGITNRYVAYVFVNKGKFSEMGFNEAIDTNLSAFRPYSKQ